MIIPQEINYSVNCVVGELLPQSNHSTLIYVCLAFQFRSVDGCCWGDRTNKCNCSGFKRGGRDGRGIDTELRGICLGSPWNWGRGRRRWFVQFHFRGVLGSRWIHRRRRRLWLSAEPFLIVGSSVWRRKFKIDSFRLPTGQGTRKGGGRRRTVLIRRPFDEPNKQDAYEELPYCALLHYYDQHGADLDWPEWHCASQRFHA